MSVFDHGEFDKHERVAFWNDGKTGLQAIIAVHNTHLGPALGGCRMWPYANSAEALTDVLRLSKGMTYKAAMAECAPVQTNIVRVTPRRQKDDFQDETHWHPRNFVALSNEAARGRANRITMQTGVVVIL